MLLSLHASLAQAGKAVSKAGCKSKVGQQKLAHMTSYHAKLGLSQCLNLRGSKTHDMIMSTGPFKYLHRIFTVSQNFIMNGKTR